MTWWYARKKCFFFRFWDSLNTKLLFSIFLNMNRNLYFTDRLLFECNKLNNNDNTQQQAKKNTTSTTNWRPLSSLTPNRRCPRQRRYRGEVISKISLNLMSNCSISKRSRDRCKQKHRIRAIFSKRHHYRWHQEITSTDRFVSTS